MDMLSMVLSYEIWAILSHFADKKFIRIKLYCTMKSYRVDEKIWITAKSSKWQLRTFVSIIRMYHFQIVFSVELRNFPTNFENLAPIFVYKQQHFATQMTWRWFHQNIMELEKIVGNEINFNKNPQRKTISTSGKILIGLTGMFKNDQIIITSPVLPIFYFHFIGGLGIAFSLVTYICRYIAPHC